MTVPDPATGVTGAPCPACGFEYLRLESRLVAQPVGTFSLAGVQTKVAATEWPHVVCDGCGISAPGERRQHNGSYVALPESVAQNAALRLREMGESALADVVSGAVIYEPDNHHNAALCPYCNYVPPAGPVSTDG